MKTKKIIMTVRRICCAGILLASVFRLAAGKLTPPTPQGEFEQRQLALIEQVRRGEAGSLARLRQKFPELYWDYQWYALDVLKSLRTQESRKLLRDIAWGKVSSPLEVEAAFRYWASLDDPEEARSLFKAPHPDVREKALELLREASVPVSARLLQAMKPILQDTNLTVRWQAGLYLATVKGPAPGREKAGALIRSASTVADMPDAQKPTGFYGAIGTRWTEADFADMGIIHALALADGIDIPLLHELLPSKSGPARDCVLIALGVRGDRSVKSELWRVIHENPRVFLRREALKAMAQIGDVTDLPALQKIADSDPVKVDLTSLEKKVLKDQLPAHVQTPDAVFPLREKAKSVILRIH